MADRKYFLNYTTKVEASRSIAEISQMLAKFGARKIMHDYDDNGTIVALSFSLVLNMDNGGEVAFRLPTDWRPVQQIIAEIRKNNTKLERAVLTDEHAQNVAWRITKDWVEAQLALLETKMVTLPQLFLPYAVTADGATLYERIAQQPGLFLGAGNGRE